MRSVCCNAKLLIADRKELAAIFTAVVTKVHTHILYMNRCRPILLPPVPGPDTCATLVNALRIVTFTGKNTLTFKTKQYRLTEAFTFFI